MRILISFIVLIGVAWMDDGLAARNSNPERPPIPRTASGRPNLEGIWVNDTWTPLERPKEIAGKAYYSRAEYAIVEKEAEAKAAPGEAEGIIADNDFHLVAPRGLVPTRRTSLVIDPADGRLPLRKGVVEMAKARRDALESYESMNAWDRCLTRGAVSLLPTISNNGYQIVQTDHDIVIHEEMIHDARIINTDGQPHVDRRIRTWLGDSRGRWEGDALVVDTTNFDARGWITTSIATANPIDVPHSEALRVVERFILVNANLMLYRATFDDPASFTAPWTVEVPFVRDRRYVIYEYACHEGNLAVELILGGARAQEGRQK